MCEDMKDLTDKKKKKKYLKGLPTMDYRYSLCNIV